MALAPEYSMEGPDERLGLGSMVFFFYYFIHFFVRERESNYISSGSCRQREKQAPQ